MWKHSTLQPATARSALTQQCARANFLRGQLVWCILVVFPFQVGSIDCADGTHHLLMSVGGLVVVGYTTHVISPTLEQCSTFAFEPDINADMFWDAHNHGLELFVLKPAWKTRDVATGRLQVTRIHGVHHGITQRLFLHVRQLHDEARYMTVVVRGHGARQPRLQCCRRVEPQWEYLTVGVHVVCYHCANYAIGDSSYVCHVVNANRWRQSTSTFKLMLFYKKKSFFKNRHFKKTATLGRSPPYQSFTEKKLCPKNPIRFLHNM